MSWIHPSLNSDSTITLDELFKLPAPNSPIYKATPITFALQELFKD